MSTDWMADAPTVANARLIECVELAVQAPSVHNTQPWRFRLGRERVDVLFDVDRRLLALDPSGREAAISVGAAILNLRVAILASGRTPLTALLPDPDQPHLAATVTLGASRRVDETIRALASAIGKRRTNRRPFRDVAVREEVLGQLVTAARVEGAYLAIADDIGREAVLGLVRTANEWQSEDPNYLEELRRWTATPFPSGEGIPVWSVGPVDESDVLPLRDFGMAHPVMPRRSARFEPAPTLAVLYSASDSLIDWLRTGQALERILLTATVRGVSNTPITAPTELPVLRSLLDDAHDMRSAQVILRLGYGDPCPPTPRRSVDDVIEFDGGFPTASPQD